MIDPSVVFAALGKHGSQPSKRLDVFPCPSPAVNWVEFASAELTAFCPVTHQPDYYKLAIGYYPDQLCIESKSMKLYLQTFREEAMFVEALADQIAQAIDDAIQPHRLSVTLEQQVRGGLQLTVTAGREKPTDAAK